MSDSNDERRFSDEEFALILRKASELQLDRPSRPPSRDGLTLPEIQQIAGEAGIDPALVARAATLISHESLSTAARILGGPATYRQVRTVLGEVPEEEMGRMVETIREVLRHQGEANRVLDTLEWKTVGETSAVCVNVSARDGETRLEVSVDRVGSGILTYFFPLVGASIIAALLGGILGLDSVQWVTTLALSAVGTAGIVARSIYSAGTRKWNETVPRLMDAISRTAESVAELPADSPEEE